MQLTIYNCIDLLGIYMYVLESLESKILGVGKKEGLIKRKKPKHAFFYFFFTFLVYSDGQQNNTAIGPQRHTAQKTFFISWDL